MSNWNKDVLLAENQMLIEKQNTIIAEFNLAIEEFRKENTKLKANQNQKAIECLKEVRKSFEKRLFGKQWEDKVYIGSICNMINDVLDNKIKELEKNNDN